MTNNKNSKAQVQIDIIQPPIPWLPGFLSSPSAAHRRFISSVLFEWLLCLAPAMSAFTQAEPSPDDYVILSHWQNANKKYDKITTKQDYTTWRECFYIAYIPPMSFAICLLFVTVSQTTDLKRRQFL